MKESLNRYNVFYGILLVALIIIGEVAIYYLKMPGWPMFAALVLFFLGHLEVKNIPAIFIGGLVGIICSVLLSYLIILLDPILGNFIPTLIFIGTFVFLIVLQALFFDPYNRWAKGVYRYILGCRASYSDIKKQVVLSEYLYCHRVLHE